MNDRFKPTRAGVINVWDYVDEEWVFADGRLALRGHNGSGKTKALEVLFPFVLDGVADSRRLDPFSGENRTMKSNLLYRGQESEYGYVWMEFARAADAAEPETVTLIIGMRAHRNTDGVRMSFFVTRLWMPVPSTSPISIVCSCAILRTSGDERWRMRSSRCSWCRRISSWEDASASIMRLKLSPRYSISSRVRLT